MSRLEKSVVLVVALLALAAVVDYALYRGQFGVSTTLGTIRDAAIEQYDRFRGTPSPSESPAAGEPAPAAAGPVRSATASPTPIGAPTASTAIPTAPAAVAAASANAPATPADAARPAATTARRALFLPGRTPTWTSFDVAFSRPIVIRAGGTVEIGTEASGPDGLEASAFERDLARRPRPSRRALSSAPYLALIGRVCSATTCTDPFLIGSHAVLCAADLKLTGQLQFWTNNYVVVDGTPTSLPYSNAAGGYSFYVEPAAEDLCGASAPAAAGLVSSRDSIALEVGQTLRNPEFVISSSQSAWKPFFVPLSTPLLLRASGTMRPTGGAESTGPRGIVVPDVPVWSYPGERSLVVDATHRLFDPSMPYQALIGRLCGGTGCTSPFLVGTERVICPAPAFSDRIELWINHIIRPGGLLGRQSPLSFDTFDLQRRSGAYRFEFSRAPDDACGN